MRTHKSRLPLVTTAVRGILGLMAKDYIQHGPSEDLQDVLDACGIELLVTDVVDAFWLVPLHPRERRYDCIRYNGVYYVFLRTAQGSRGAPLTWAAVAAVLARLLQSLFVTSTGQEARLQVYVDDPLLAVRGSQDRRRLLAARFIAGFLILGARLAFPKAQLGARVAWIGVQLHVRRGAVEAAILEEKLQALLEIIVAMLANNVVPIKDVRSLAGKGSNISTVVYMWRPFLAQLWASLSTTQTNAPENCVWTRQIEVCLHWLLASSKVSPDQSRDCLPSRPCSVRRFQWKSRLMHLSLGTGLGFH